MEDQTKIRIFEKLDELKDGQHELAERMTRIESEVKHLDDNFEAFTKHNDDEHNKMVSLIKELQDSDKEQEATLQQRSGMHKVVWWIVGGIGALACGGAGYILEKLMGG